MHPGEFVQFFIVGNVHAGLNIIGSFTEGNRNTKLQTLAHGLRGNGQRRHNEGISTCRHTHPMRPFKLHRGLAKPAIGKNSGAALCQRPTHDVLLEVVQLVVEIVLSVCTARSDL